MKLVAKSLISLRERCLDGSTNRSLRRHISANCDVADNAKLVTRLNKVVAAGRKQSVLDKGDNKKKYVVNAVADIPPQLTSKQNNTRSAAANKIAK